MNAIQEFATSFSYLTLHAVNLLLWNKILSLTFFKIITVSRISTLLRDFVMGRLGYHTKGGIMGAGGVYLQDQTSELSPSVGYHSHQKIEPPCPYLNHRSHIGKKAYLMAFRQILPKIFAWGIYFQQHNHD